MLPAIRASALLSLWLASPALTQDKPFLTSEFIFPLEHWHNHSSSLVELPGGDLFAVWYHGSGERTADDVIIESSRLRRGSKQWTPRQTIADTPGFPDCNSAVFLDSQKRLWLMWPVILANEWHTALMKYRISSDYADPSRLPRWDISDNMLFVPRNFTEVARRAIEPRLKAAAAGSREETYLKRLWEYSGDKYFMRMGWMPRAHPVELPSGRIIVPLYSDGYDFSLMAITDDGGKSWITSEPLVGAGNIQPSIARKRDGTLVAYMRDNGPPPKRLHVSESKDDGITWSTVKDSDLPNPGAGAEVIVLKDNTWALIYNDTERERYSLAVALSDDEGATWKWKRHLELDTRAERRGAFHYPSIIQARDGSLHATYSYFLNHLPATAARKSIKHAHFNTAWVKQGDPN
jgi:predicted neuraminidase